MIKMKFPISKTKKKYITIYIISLILIITGLYYNPYYFAKVLSNTGQLPKKYVYIVYFMEFLIISLAILIIIFKRWIYKKRKELIITIVTLFLMFVLLEVSFRGYLYFINPGEQPKYLNMEDININRKYIRHHYLNYFPAPNCVSMDGLNKHNSLGYRGEEFEINKPTGTYRIVTLGGSTTYTENVRSYKDSYPFQLEIALKEKYNHSNVEVINAGVGGYDSWENLINFQFRVLDLEPDLIIVYLAGNDVHSRLVNPKYYRGDNSGRRKPWEDSRGPLFFNSCLMKLIFTKLTGKSMVPGLGQFVTAKTAVPAIQNTEYSKILDGTPAETLKKNKPVYFERNMRNIIAIANEHNISVMLVSWSHSDEFDDYSSTPHYKSAYKAHNKLIKRIAKEKRVYFYDFVNDMPSNKKYWSDGRHVNERGSKLKAYLFAKYIDNKILK